MSARRKLATNAPDGAVPRRGLPEPFAGWFQARGWHPRDHQLALLDTVTSGRDTLLIAPTGGGKTLAGFLPSLIDLASQPPKTAPATSIHTLYVSPLKALATDIARNLAAPVTEMGLAVTLETRTGDTPPSRRARQRVLPPDILLTTPEQIALMLSHKGAAELFGGLKCVILDELHALASSKRGDLLALDLARLRTLSPDMTAIGLSATVARPAELAAFLVPHRGGETPAPAIVIADGGIAANITILKSRAELPWAGHSARYALPEIYEAIKAHRLSLIFVNTRSQAEMLFHELWRCNDDNLPIALHHGSLDVGQRRKVEAAMVAGKLRGVVCTSTLDLGIDWGDVDLVINVGAPKGASRLTQRIGRANHRLDEPSKALLVPANKFEVMECQAALEAAAEGAQDTPPAKPGALDVLAQHVLGMACSAPFHPEVLYEEVTSAAPYRHITREGFGQVLNFVANEYALAIWGLKDMSEMVRSGRLDLRQLFDEDMLGDDLDAWLAESNLMKRSFRICAIISGLIERRHPGQEKTGRQMTVSSDLIYDVLRQHEPEHLLLKAAFADAATGLIDVGRLGQFLKRIGGRIRHSALVHVSPLAVPVMLEIGRESILGDVGDTLLREAAEDLIAEALGDHAAR